MKRFIVILAVLLCLGAPAAATAQFGPNAPSPLLAPDDPKAQPFEEDTGLSTLQLVLIFGGAAAVIGVIAAVIVRDARGRAAAKRPGSGSGSRSGSESESGRSPRSAAQAARERERQKARKRSKAKAARNQRKHNRPR